MFKRMLVCPPPGVPRNGIAFSRGASWQPLTAPRWSDAAFELEPGLNKAPLLINYFVTPTTSPAALPRPSTSSDAASAGKGSAAWWGDASHLSPGTSSRSHSVRVSRTWSSPHAHRPVIKI